MRSRLSDLLKGVIIGAGVMVTGTVLADVSLPFTFAPSTVIKSSEVNGDLAALNTGKQDKLGSIVAKAATAGPKFDFSHPLADNNPKAIIVVTHHAAQGGDGFAHPYGVLYDLPSSKWQIYAEDGASILAGQEFNVFIMAAAQ
jgi:hypothetical protein